ncbi:MAG: HI1506-related protein [Desulfovibrio sp.]
MHVIPAIVRTRSLRGGHYRAGLRHEAEPGDIPPGTVTEEQLARLRADPDLEVEVIDPPQDPQPRKKKPATPAGLEAGTAGDSASDLGAAMAGEGTTKAQTGGDSAEAAGGGADGDEDFGFDGDPETPEPGAKGK